MGNGVGPWPGGLEHWPEGEHWDPDLLAGGDRRNVEDRFRYWRRDAIRDFLAVSYTHLTLPTTPYV